MRVRDPRPLVLERAAPVLRVVGALLLAAGAARMLVDGDTALRLVAAGLALPGTVLVGWRRRREIDLVARSERHLVGWGPLVRRRSRPLAAPIAIAVGPPRWLGDAESRRSVVPLALVTADGTDELAAISDALTARAWGERLARAWAVPLRDASIGALVERDAAQLDLPLLARIDDEDLAAPLPPAARIRVRAEDDGVRLVLARPPSGCLVAAVLVPLALATAVWAMTRSEPLLPERPPATAETVRTVVSWLAYALPAALVALVPATAVVLGHRAAVVRVSPRAGIRARAGRIAPERLEGLRFDRREGTLVAIADDRELRLGRGLRDDELTALRALVLRVLRGLPDPVQPPGPAPGTGQPSSPVQS